MSARLKTVAARLEAYATRDDATGCLVWQRGTYSNGYGRVAVGGGRDQLAHRAAYEFWVGPIPDGMVVDHLCRNRACIEPTHLRVCTQRDNVMAAHSMSPPAICARKTHCSSGHEFTEENTRITSQGKRECITCRREWDRRRAATPARKEYERLRSIRRREAGGWRKAAA